jgi:hypothetical protein
MCPLLVLFKEVSDEINKSVDLERLLKEDEMSLPRFRRVSSGEN